MAKKRRSSQFKDTSQVIDIEEARRKRQEKRQKQQSRAKQVTDQPKRTVRASVKAGRRKKNIIYAVIILCIIAAIGVSVLNLMTLKADYKEAEKQNQQLTEQKKELEKQLEDSSKDEYIEDEAREQLRMVKPGETVYMVPYTGEAEKTTESDKE